MDVVEPKDTAEVSLIVLRKIRPQLLQYSPNPSKVRGTIEPIIGFVRNRRTICALGSGPTDDFAHIIKGRKAPQELTDRLRRIFLTVYFDESLIPPGWGIWRGLITRFHLRAPPLRRSD